MQHALDVVESDMVWIYRLPHWSHIQMPQLHIIYQHPQHPIDDPIHTLRVHPCPAAREMGLRLQTGRRSERAAAATTLMPRSRRWPGRCGDEIGTTWAAGVGKQGKQEGL